MWMLALTTTLAAPTEVDAEPTPSPPRLVHGDAFLSTGVVAGGMGFTLGVAGDARNQGVVVFGEAAAGGRTRGISGRFPQEPGIVMTTVGVCWT